MSASRDLKKTSDPAILERSCRQSRGDGVAVIIPARDAEPWIEQSILSALAQAETSEVIFVDDGSGDQTADIAAAIALRDPRVVCLRPPGAPVGAGAARNFGVQASSADVLAFLDADDYLLPAAFSVALEEFKNPKLDVVLSTVSILAENPLERLDRSLHDPVSGLASKDWLSALCEGAIGVPVCSALTRRAAFFHVGGFDETLPIGQDLVLWLKLAAGSTVTTSRAREPVGVYRRHAGNRSGIGGHGPVQAGVWACLQAWRWAASNPGTSETATALLLRGAGLRQRQLILRALRGNLRAGRAALVNGAREPRVFLNRGFWVGAAAIVRH